MCATAPSAAMSSGTCAHSDLLWHANVTARRTRSRARQQQCEYRCTRPRARSGSVSIICVVYSQPKRKCEYEWSWHKAILVPILTPPDILVILHHLIAYNCRPTQPSNARRCRPHSLRLPSESRFHTNSFLVGVGAVRELCLIANHSSLRVRFPSRFDLATSSRRLRDELVTSTTRPEHLITCSRPENNKFF
jgi:hypothetical protein